MESSATRKAFRTGDVLIREGDVAEEMFVVTSGRVKVTKGKGANETTLAILGPGEYLGEMALLADFPRSATVTALDDTEVTVIDRMTFRAHINDPMVLDVMRKMAERIRDLGSEVFDARQADESRRAHLGSIMEQRHWFV